jgi:hypothetical protein
MADGKRKYSWHIGKHPSVIALEMKLRETSDQEAPHPPPGLPLDEHMAIFERGMEAFAKVQVQWRDLTDEIASRFDQRGLPPMAFCSEPFLSEVLSDTYAPYDFAFDLLFRQNYRFGYSTQINDLQAGYVRLDAWLGRIGNSGAGTMFTDPCPQCLDVWTTLNLLDWPKFERRWRRAITTIMRTTEAEIESALADNNGDSAAKKLVDRAFGPGKFSQYGITWEDFSEPERTILEEIEAFTHDKFGELEARVLKSIWAHRSRLIQAHPDGGGDPEEWRLASPD